jgi:hypothetical protein
LHERQEGKYQVSFFSVALCDVVALLTGVGCARTMTRFAHVFGLSLGLTACGRTEVVRYSTDGGERPSFDAGFDAGLPCQPGVISPARAVPTLMFVLDRSGSMAFDVAGHTGMAGDPLMGPSRWSLLRTSLSRTLPTYDNALAMGVTLFPANDTLDACDVSAAIQLSPQVGNAASVLSLFGRLPSGGTPTYEGLSAASGVVTDVKGSVLVLVTDGEPNCNATLDASRCQCTMGQVGQPPRCPDAESCLDDGRTIALVKDLATNRHLATYVIGVGQTGIAGDLSRTLDALAVAGGVPLAGGAHRYYRATSEAELTSALNDISARVSRCTFVTQVALTAGDRMEVRVGASVVPAQANGWQWVDEAAGRFTLSMAWCERAVAGEAVTIELACH